MLTQFRDRDLIKIILKTKIMDMFKNSEVEKEMSKWIKLIAQ